MNILKIINSKILYKLIIGFVSISLLVGIVSYIGISTINKIERSYGLISTKSLPLVQYLKDMKFACLRLVSSATEYALIESESKNKSQSENLEQEGNLIKQSCNSCHQAFFKYKQLVNISFPELVGNTNKIRKEGDSLHIVTVEFIEMIKQGISGSEILEKKEEMEVYEMHFLESVTHTIEHTNKKLEEEKTKLELIISSSIKNIFIFSGLTFLISLLIGILYSRSLSKPITKLTQQVNDFRKGNLDVAIDIKSFDEIGVLGKSFQEMAEKIKRLISQLEDEIKESKKAHEALIESESKLRSFMERVPIGIYRTTPDGKFLFANPSLVKILGYDSFEDLQKINLEEQDFENQQKRKLFKEKIETFGDITQHEDIFVRKDGSQIIVNEYAICVRDEEDNVKYYEGIVEDVTERKKAVDSLKKSQHLLLELNDLKDKFFSIIAHDLKGPFNGFLGLTKILAEEILDMTMNEMQDYSKKMHESAKNLLQLLENLLTWAKSQSKSLEFKRTNFDLSVPAKECISLLNPIALNKGIELRSEIKENTNIYADYNMITTVIRNLISNAIKFTNKDGYVIISSDEAQDNENYIVVSIKDNGVGMDKEAVEKLFRLDVRQSTRGTSDEKGTGLGLLICKEFVEKIKGEIWAESEKGNGSIFRFTVPKHEQLDIL